MKRITFLLLLLPAFTLTSCSDGDENEPMQVFPDVAATYKLINVSGSIAGVSHDFAPGTITWRFNTNQTVTVVNTIPMKMWRTFLGRVLMNQSSALRIYSGTV